MTLEELVVKISGDTSGLESSFGKIAGAAGKAVAAASAAAAAGVAALTKSAIQSYADYEQLIGGVETLFKDSAGLLEEYANNAYKTAGLSANEYMETVTSFSASLLQSLGGDTEAAAKAADQALTDMADNANKMGTSMESIQNAYQGFAKQNYTMLDNLKLGYGGTKKEMERLLADAQELTGIEYNIDNLADVYDAIHVIQTELGITGTTAKEAASTISGSAAMMKASWKNLLTGIANENADFETLIQNFVDSVVTFMDNIMPRIEVALGGIAELINALVPIIADALPGLIESILPSILEAITSLLDAIIAAIPELLPVLIEAATGLLFSLIESIIAIFPEVIAALMECATMIMNAISENLPMIMQALIDGLIMLVDSIIANLPMFLDAFIQLIMSFCDAMVQALPQLIAALPQLIEGIVGFISQSIPQIVEAGVTLFVALIQSLPEIITTIVAALPQIIDSIVSALLENIPVIVQAGVDLLTALVENLPAIIEAIVAALPEIITAIIDAIVELLPEIVEAGVTLFTALITNLPEIILTIISAIPEIIASIVSAIIEKLPDIIQAGYDLVVGLFEGISNAGSWLWGKLKGWCGNVLSWIKGFFGIASPSKKMMEDGKYLVEGLAKGISNNTRLATLALQKTALAMEQAFNPLLTVPEVDTNISFNRDSLSAITDMDDITPYVTLSGANLTIEEENRLQTALQNNNADIISTLLQNTRQLLDAIEEKELYFSIGDEDIAASAARGNISYKRRTGTPLFV